jgi:hypothetical protein
MTDRVERITAGCVTAVVAVLALLIAAAVIALLTIPPPHPTRTDPSHQEIHQP